MWIPLVIFIALSVLSYVNEAQSTCSSKGTETLCNAQTSCSWVGSTIDGVCRCSSNVKLDILFAIDTSGSIGLSGFQIQKTFLKDLVLQGINGDDAKLGFVMFSTKVNFSEPIQAWETNALDNYVSGIRWVGGYTNTPDVIDESLLEFQGKRAGSNYAPNTERQQVLLMITDGNPCLPESLGGCPQSVCQYAGQVKLLGIRVIIIGVGKDLNTLYVECLCQTSDDFIPVDTFSELSTLLGSLSDIFCPMTKDFKVTEVKALKKDASWTTDGRLSRFIEFYNMGVEFNLNEITASGMMTMAQGPDIMVSQAQYVVFYDANDDPTASIVSCHWCGTDCVLDDCPAGVKAASTTDYCWCSNSIYVACGNAEDGACNAGSALNVPQDAKATAISGCGLCSFNDMGKENWNIRFEADDALVDEVIHETASKTWITTTDGFSYELRSKGYDNDFGGNWGQSCVNFGTPGADPAAACAEQCIANGCGGGNECLDNGLCDCDTTTGYYPQCTSPTSCAKCLLVPQVDDCSVFWTKNGTKRTATYEWDLSARDDETRYILTTYSGSLKGKTIQYGLSQDDYIYAPVFATSNYWPDNTTYGGYVQVAIDQCTDDGNGNEVCKIYTSQLTMCKVITSPPTLSPTPAPTDPPTRHPTPLPTVSPTYSCPEVYWTGGTEQDICVPDDRCNCAVASKDCCLLEPNFAVTYDPNRKHHEKFDCKLDVQKKKGVDYRKASESDAGSSPGYLLTMNQMHFFEVGVLPTDYSCAMDIFWRFEWTRTDCSYESDRRRLADCDDSLKTPEQVGMDIDIQSGFLYPKDAQDGPALTVKFRVTPLDCPDDDADADDTTTRRRLAPKTDCFDGVALYGNLVIVNATSHCRPDCWDARIYPMSIPVWYNYDAAYYIPPGREKAFPAWLWWLVAALAIFLCCLLFLVYKYWWKAQATGAALTGVQKDLDAAVMEAEDGFGQGLQGDAVGFNPLATGFNPNAPAGNGVPNRPPDANPRDANFIRPNVERPKFQVEYGQQMGNLR